MSTCSIEGCEKPRRSKGWCLKHYTRWKRHGSPLANLRSTPVGVGLNLICHRESEVRRFWEKAAVPDANGCMLWLGGLDADGYGHMRVGGKEGACLGAHRISLHLLVGPPERADLFAIHSCRNRHCVAPAHLRWGTHAENEADKLRDGTILRGELHPRMKVSDAQALEIRRRYELGGFTYKQLADEYGVHHDTIARIIRRRVRFRQEAS